MGDSLTSDTFRVGQFVHAITPYGAGKVCRVLALTPAMVAARDIIRQSVLTFSRSDGIEQDGDGRLVSRIDFAGALPDDVIDVLAGLDERFRLGLEETRARLSHGEKSALLHMCEAAEARPVSAEAGRAAGRGKAHDYAENILRAFMIDQPAGR